MSIEFRRSQCHGKHAFPSAVLAMRVARQSRRRHHGEKRPPRAYRCDACGRWHIGGSNRERD